MEDGDQICMMCGDPYPPPTSKAQKEKRFCTESCRASFHLACRRIGLALAATGYITEGVLRIAARGPITFRPNGAVNALPEGEFVSGATQGAKT